jgi:imidazolonepropionase-like amidohydrolase
MAAEERSSPRLGARCTLSIASPVVPSPDPLSALAMRLLLLALALPLGAALAQPRTVALTVGAHDPALSSDGARIAVSIVGRIWTLPASGGEAAMLTSGGGWDSHPAWSSDGRFLAYARAYGDGADLIVRNLETGTEATAYHTQARLGQLAFAPSGGSIFAVVERGQYDAHLWRIPLGDGEPVQLTFTPNWHEWSFALSPDASRVLVESGHYGGADLYLIAPDSSDLARRVTRTPATNEHAVAWSRDGRTRAWVAETNAIDSLFVEREGAAPRAILASPFDGKQLAISADGVTLVMAAGRKLWRVDVASGRATPIPFTARVTPPATRPANLVITHARVWTGEGDSAVSDATVEVRDGRIVAVRSAAATDGATATSGVETIDAKGRTLIPGLVDNHWHFWDPADGATLLARGVTTIRDPGVRITESATFRDAIDLGLVPGPTIYTAGPLIDGVGGYHPYVDVELSRPDAATALVKSLKANGADFLKVYFMLDPPVLRAVIAAAHAEGMKVTGHIGVHTGWGEALDAGIDGLNHIRVWKDFLPRELQAQGDSETLDGGKWPTARMQADWSRIDPDGPEALALIRRMASAKVGFDPTLTVQRVGPEARTSFGLEAYAVARDAYRRMQRFVGRAFREGVPLLAGTDDGNLFDEIEAYQEAGIPAPDALRAATINGARWLGREREFGSIAPGRRADFVLVDGDPLRDVKDVRKIVMVIKGGRVAFAK